MWNPHSWRMVLRARRSWVMGSGPYLYLMYLIFSGWKEWHWAARPRCFHWCRWCCDLRCSFLLIWVEIKGPEVKFYVLHNVWEYFASPWISMNFLILEYLEFKNYETPDESKFGNWWHYSYLRNRNQAPQYNETKLNLHELFRIMKFFYYKPAIITHVYLLSKLLKSSIPVIYIWFPGSRTPQTPGFCQVIKHSVSI